MTATVSATAADRVVRAAGPALGVPCLLLMFGELALKKRKRTSFAVVLQRNLGRACAARATSRSIAAAPPSSCFRRPTGSRTALEVATELPGLSVVQPALRVEPEVERAAYAAVQLLRGAPGSFAVRARRREKSFPVGSMEIARLVGSAINEQLGLAVDLSHPEVELRVDAYARELFVVGRPAPRERAVSRSVRAGGRSCCSRAESIPPSPPTG